ncbi:hypothetical protein HK102_007133 [Quaeritorhiza haematococci]|nr:hypothetical protein HK102_007133 [Quaeritorhiza haematococci]
MESSTNGSRKVFTAGNKEWNITVKGTHKHPLFRATDVGKVLEIKNIYTSMQNFMEGKHWVLQKVDTLGGQQNVKFFTKTGLFKIMMRSRSAFAESFQDWVAEVITEIQETGQYRIQSLLQKQVDESKTKLLEFQEEKAAIEARADEDRKRAEEAEAARKEAEAKAAEEQKRREELELKLQRRTYEPIEKTGHVYVIETDGGIKVGETKKDVPCRVKGMQTANRNDIKILLDFETSNPDLLERTVHYILDRYRSNSNREFFDCDTEHIKRVVILAGNTIDTLKSMYENISQDEFITRVNENVGISMCCQADVESVQVPDPCDKDKLADFLEIHCKLGEGFQVLQADFIASYRRIHPQANKGPLKEAMSQMFGRGIARNDKVEVGKRIDGDGVERPKYERGWKGIRLK